MGASGASRSSCNVSLLHRYHEEADAERIGSRSQCMRLIVGAITRPFAACGILPAWESINLRGLKYCVAILFVIMNLSQAHSKDMQVLIRILDAAFAAEQMSTICMSAKINLSENDKEVFKSAVIYSQGARRHVIAGLSVSDVDFVLSPQQIKLKLVQRQKLRHWLLFHRHDLPTKNSSGAQIR